MTLHAMRRPALAVVVLIAVSVRAGTAEPQTDRLSHQTCSGSVLRRDLRPLVKPKPALIIAGEKDQLVPFALQRASLDAVIRLNGADRTGETWADSAVLHKSSKGLDVGAYLYSGDHTMPANAGALMARFFVDRAQASVASRRARRAWGPHAQLKEVDICISKVWPISSPR